jgi:alpha-1,6-mannosyltransferase
MIAHNRHHWSSARPWQTNTALIIIGIGLLLLTRQLVSEFHHFTIGFSGVSGWSATLYGAAVLLILTQPVNRYTLVIIVGFAIAFRLVALLPGPYLSSDIYRYVWDGVVQHAHISPYRYVPGDPALAFLREPNQNLFDHINRRNYAHTIYPPAAQFLFYLITFIKPTVTFMKLAMILFEGLTLYVLVEFLGALGIRREQSLLYAWCPLLVWEIGSSGHLDSAAMAFIALALLARYRQRPIATGVFIGIAILIKIYPLVLLPALFRRGEYRMPITVAAIITFAYACYSSAGMRVFGFLGGYVQEEGMQSGNRYFLLELTHHIPGFESLPTISYIVFCCLAFAALTLWCWKTCCNPRKMTATHTQTRIFALPGQAHFLTPVFALSFTLMLLFSPHYPWYIAWLIPFFTLMPNLTVFAYICGVFYLLTTAMAVGYGPQQFLLNKILYSTVLLALGIELLLRRWPIHRTLLRINQPGAQTSGDNG